MSTEGRFLRVAAAIAERTDVSASAKLVHGVIAAFEATGSRQCYLSIAGIGKRIGRSERAARGHVAELAGALCGCGVALLEVQPRQGDTCLFHVHTPAETCRGSGLGTPAETRRGPRQKPAGHPGRNLPDTPAETCRQRDQGGDQKKKTLKRVQARAQRASDDPRLKLLLDAFDDRRRQTGCRTAWNRGIWEGKRSSEAVALCDWIDRQVKHENSIRRPELAPRTDVSVRRDLLADFFADDWARGQRYPFAALCGSPERYYEEGWERADYAKLKAQLDAQEAAGA